MAAFGLLVEETVLISFAVYMNEYALIYNTFVLHNFV